MVKHLFTALFCTVLLQNAPAQSAPSVQVRYTEAYELANVILALTPYGISDPNEVQKGTPYYNEVLRWFEPVKNHPLLQKVNYSRELWDHYLSFRTDSYAFSFDENGKLKRDFAFFSQRGLKPFDDNLALIQDFVEKSGYRNFFKQQQPYYQSIADRCLRYYMMSEMQAFLVREFGDLHAGSQNLMVISPLVNRMNCHRPIDKHSAADFATLGMTMILADQAVDPVKQAADIHTLFSEADHGFVNPVSDQYAKSIAKNFKYKKWDRGSGYTGISCFNEYMTWAVYDLFVKEYFPAVADSVIRDWHFQNNNRGFIASSLFGEELCRLYAQKKPEQRIKDLYPAILAWSGELQNRLQEPKLAQDSLNIALSEAGNWLSIRFSEPLKPMPVLDASYFKVIDGQRSFIRAVEFKSGETLDIQGNTLRVRISEPPSEAGLYGLSFNAWGRRYELRAENGAPAATPTRFYMRIR